MTEQTSRVISDRGLRFIGGWEGFEGRLYNDPAGHCTIGFGHLVHHGRCNGSEPAQFKRGITRTQGLALLRQDAKRFAVGVEQLIEVRMSQHEFDALVSFAFNIGLGAFECSTLRGKLNAGDRKSVPSELARWTNGGMAGLVRRRRAEGVLFKDGRYGTTVSRTPTVLTANIEESTEIEAQAFDELDRCKASPYTAGGPVEGYWDDVVGAEDPTDRFWRISKVLADTHTTPRHYDPPLFLYPCVDLRPEGHIESIYTGDRYDPRALIAEDLAVRARRIEALVESLAESELDARYPYNCEHVVPQSWFDYEEPMRGDLHHLFTCEAKCNSFRGNYAYTDFADYREVIRDKCGKREAEGFEPHRSKGTVSRAALYFILRYPARATGAFRLEQLLAWHIAEPPDAYEHHRNEAIWRLQGNRNPMIDHPSWAIEIDFSAGVG